MSAKVYNPAFCVKLIKLVKRDGQGVAARYSGAEHDHDLTTTICAARGMGFVERLRTDGSPFWRDGRTSARSVCPLQVPLTSESTMLDFAQPTTIGTPPAITAVAGFVASASVRRDSAAGALEVAMKGAAGVRGRVSALEAERTAIIQRRARGVHQDDDASRLALIAADLDGLAPLVAEADAAVAQARAKVQAEDQQVAHARNQLDRAEAEARLTALLDHARKLDSLMVAMLDQVTQAAAALGVGGRPPFAPSTALVATIRRHAAAHGRL